MLPRSLPVLVMTALLATTAGPAATGSPAAAVASAAPAAATAPANSAPTPLDKYLDDLHTLRTSFLQTLADPHGREIDRATGTLIVQRPGRFSWDVHPQPVANDHV